MSLILKRVFTRRRSERSVKLFKNKKKVTQTMKILKFGGSSLANGEGLENSLAIIEEATHEPIAVVVSARGKSTDELESMLKKAASGSTVEDDLTDFFRYQTNDYSGLVFDEERQVLGDLFHAVSLTGEYSPALKDRILSYGELISAKTIVHLLKQKQINACFVDSRELIKTEVNGSIGVLSDESQKLVSAFFKQLPQGELAVITGFIASDMKGNTTTLGRNGSNYTATLLANYLDQKSKTGPTSMGSTPPIRQWLMMHVRLTF